MAHRAIVNLFAHNRDFDGFSFQRAIEQPVDGQQSPNLTVPTTTTIIRFLDRIDLVRVGKIREKSSSNR